MGIFFAMQPNNFAPQGLLKRIFYYLCRLIMITPKDFIEDEIYGQRLLISVNADQTELNDNIRVARVLLSCFDDMYIVINDVIEKLRT